MTITDIGGAALEVRITPSHQRLDLQAYTSILSEVRKSLEEVDRIAIPARTPRMQWAIKDMSMRQDVRILLVPKVIPNKRAISTLSVPTEGLVSGVRSLSRVAEIPAYFTDATVHRVEQIGKHVRSGDVDRVSVASMRIPTEAAVVDQATTINAARAIEPVKKSFSSVTGVLEVLEHRTGRSPRAFLRVDGSKHGVRVEAREDQSSLLREAWGERVLAEGLLKRNILGQPVSLVLDTIENAPDRGNALSPWELLGVDPDFTEGLSTEEYIRRVRRG
ncbi:hypothetical protein [Streptomyces sp. FIT100]|uniref:hypothetical protein n=1 Tax=Streptomyces sp. FIT100 TaxID=2837956 RepID=UPI0021CAE109|nr:hypothetical protein [Streptomyces sp. FIT100]UUN28585.1 hypothetical protein KK483_21025 [Streptomyces sp. FIT100]